MEIVVSLVVLVGVYPLFVLSLQDASIHALIRHVLG